VSCTCSGPQQATKRTTLVLLEPDVAEAFPDGRTVNEALRAFVKVARSQKIAAVYKHQ
jgi:hypothetical protein